MAIYHRNQPVKIVDYVFDAEWGVEWVNVQYASGDVKGVVPSTLTADNASEIAVALAPFRMAWKPE